MSPIHKAGSATKKKKSAASKKKKTAKKSTRSMAADFYSFDFEPRSLAKRHPHY